ncbi:MAG: aldo/keto reductase [Gammaproteobacteria bacterium]|nr:aldo/keto reductase [Gammaproteobacteria bacterium]
MYSGRRSFLKTLALTAAALSGGAANGVLSAPSARIQRTIPVSGETLPVIGMGSWRTFNVGKNRQLRDQRVEVLRAFLDNGGGMIDSSPMYGSSEEVIGYCLSEIGGDKNVFAASKVWTGSPEQGRRQIADSQELWKLPVMDLMQVHNLLSWEAHLQTLREKKAAGEIRYIGVTTSHGRRHDLLEQILEREPIDFVQLTYNIRDRDAEQRLLPLAREKSVAVIANMPFDKGDLFDRYADKPLPDWAGEFDCRNWAQFFLKFVVSHPAISCAIPATSRVDHMQQNMGAGVGLFPDQALRKKMIDYLAAL